MESRELQKAKIPLIRTKQKKKTHPGSQSRRYQTCVSVSSQKEQILQKLKRKQEKKTSESSTKKNLD